MYVNCGTAATLIHHESETGNCKAIVKFLQRNDIISEEQNNYYQGPSIKAFIAEFF